MPERNITWKLAAEFGLAFFGASTGGFPRSGLSHSETSLLGEAALEKEGAEAGSALRARKQWPGR